ELGALHAQQKVLVSVQDPLEVRLEANDMQLEAADVQQLDIKVRRPRQVSGPIRLSVEDLPLHVSSDPLTLAGSATAGSLWVSSSEEVEAASAKKAIVVA